MSRHHIPTVRALSTIARLASPPRIEDTGPVAARFIYSLRLIAVHERAGRDPVPELALRLGSVEIAARTLALSQTITATWPENIHVSRFCCGLLTHDEATIGALIDAVCARSRTGFEHAIEGFVRPERMYRLWDAGIALVEAEHRRA
ncbi:DNA-directed RNA polymerase subunit beta' [Erythrobacter sp. JK5]|uniref:DNA-directed RNA polymerase subunit beta' n=1 Tax=Erythrobacter sp. JK5 TaxID=2829500 RepID=UPI001BADCD05|nr:DNA-directed RNA polymerase subunit beta' [Erythrobacter sp. JK5]QUL37560.1 DNA-directed RNA polymerase subunit beta' [Erythrobacter sp. JK5]